MSDAALGTMYLVYNEVLVVNQSNDICFYKIEFDEEEQTKRWMMY